MTPTIGELVYKARDCLARARIILDACVGEEVGVGRSVPLDRASAAINRAAQLVEQVYALLA